MVAAPPPTAAPIKRALLAADQSADAGAGAGAAADDHRRLAPRAIRSRAALRPRARATGWVTVRVRTTGRVACCRPFA